MDIFTELMKELSVFPGREEQLRKIKRWDSRSPMFYRPDLFTHSKHVAWLVMDVIPTVKRILSEPFDEKRAIALALVHDDAEIIMGDYAAGNKAKMTPKQLAFIAQEEQEAIEVISKKFPQRIGEYDYRELLEDIVELHTPEAQVAKYLDRIDGFGEGLHEIYAGNPNFVGTVTNQYGVTPKFDELNVMLRTSMVEKYTILQNLKESHVFFSFTPLLEWQEIIKNKHPYTKDSVALVSGYDIYDRWKKVILSSGDSEEIKNLYTQQEFL